MIVFLHIAKCGGSTIRNYIRKSLSSPVAQSDPRKTVFVYGENSRIGDYNVSGFNLCQLATILQPHQCKAVVGHFTYRQLADYLHHCNTYANAFSLIRNPIDRFISNINYIKLSPGRPAFKHMQHITHENLFDYMKGSALRGAGCFQLSSLTLKDKLDPSNLRMIESEIEIASKSLRLYKVEHSLAALKECVLFFDATHSVQKSNITKDHAYVDTQSPLLCKQMLSDVQLQELSQLFWPDMMLYDLAS